MGEENSQGKCSFSLEPLKFFDSCSVAGATQCHGNTGICFHQRVAFPAKLAAAIDEPWTGKHFHTACARRGVLHEVTFTFWSSIFSLPLLCFEFWWGFLLVFFLVLCLFGFFSCLPRCWKYSSQWTQGCLRICTLQGQNSKGEKNKYCVMLSFPAQQSWDFLQTSSCCLQPFWGSSLQPALWCGVFWKKLVFSFDPESSLCHLWPKLLYELGDPLCFVYHREGREIPWG